METENPTPGGAPAPEAFKAPDVNLFVAGKAIAAGVEQRAAEAGILDSIKNFFIWLVGYALGFYFSMLGEIAVVYARAIAEAENRSADTFAELSAAGVSDLFGIEPNVAQFKGKNSRSARTALSRELGKSVIEGLFPNIDKGGPESMQPSDAPAREMAGFMLQFCMEGWLSGLSAEVASLGEIETYGELDDIVSNTLGLGRMARTALRPAVDISITTPLKWKLNKQYRPEQLTPVQVCDQYHQGRITEAEFREEMSRQGYTDSRMDFLYRESRKKFAMADIAFLVRLGYWSQEQAQAALVDDGWPAGNAATVLTIERLKRIDAVKQDVISAVTQAYIDKDVDADYFQRTCVAAGMEPEVFVFAKQAAGLRRELKRTRMSESDAQTAVKKGFWNFQEYMDFLSEKDMRDEDVITKRLLLQDEIREDLDAEKKRKAAEAERAATKKARQDAALARQQELDAARNRSQLSIAQAERLFIRGRLTLDQYQAFLIEEKYKASDVNALVELAVDNQADYQKGLQARADADRRANASSLSASLMEHAVEAGIMTVEDYSNVLRAQGTSDGDIAIVVRVLQLNLAERADAKKRRDEAAAELNKKGLSLGQFEIAARRGLRTVGQYVAFLKAEGFSTEDQETLAGLLQDTLDADVEAKAKRDKAAVDLLTKNVSLAEMEQAVRRGLRPLSDYAAMLTRAGYPSGDVQLLEGLLRAQIADDQAVAQRKTELAAKLKPAGISLADLERAVVLGIIPMARYQSALAENGVSGSDAQILIALLQDRVAQAAAAKVVKEQAEQKMKVRTLSQADLIRGVKKGFRTMAEYQSALAFEGFDLNSQQLLVQLLQDELDQLEAARLRKAELDSTVSPREISRVDLERAIKAGIRPFIAYYPWLVAQGYSELDQGTLAQLLANELP